MIVSRLRTSSNLLAIHFLGLVVANDFHSKIKGLVLNEIFLFYHQQLHVGGTALEVRPTDDAASMMAALFKRLVRPGLSEPGPASTVAIFGWQRPARPSAGRSS